MDKFCGDLDDLVAVIEEMRDDGSWFNLGSCVRFEARSGPILVLWCKKRILHFQGPAKKAADFRSRFIDAAGDKYRRVPEQGTFFGGPLP